MSDVLAFHDYRWHGGPATVDAAIDVLAPESTLGPRVLDGIAYVGIRLVNAADLPAGLTSTGPELSLALLGDWMGEEAE